MNGSANFQDCQSRGYVIGTPKYAGSEPHHARTGDGAWTYETMYHEATERLLAEIFEGSALVKKDGCHLRWSEAEGTRLVSHHSGEAVEIPLPSEDLVLFFHDDGGIDMGDGNFETFDGIIGRE